MEPEEEIAPRTISRNEYSRRLRLTEAQREALAAEYERRRAPRVATMATRVESLLAAFGSRKVGCRIDRLVSRCGLSIFDENFAARVEAIRRDCAA